ncbi:MAG: hypothetical protein ACYTBJ_02175 [Planctomycetota bacterium]|jgi:hypothetical protein
MKLKDIMEDLELEAERISSRCDSLEDAITKALHAGDARKVQQYTVAHSISIDKLVALMREMTPRRAQ